MAFKDPNAPVIARLFATDTPNNERIEIDSYRSEGVTTGGQIRFYGQNWTQFEAAFLELVTQGLDPSIDSVFTINGPKHNGGSGGQILLYHNVDDSNDILVAAEHIGLVGNTVQIDGDVTFSASPQTVTLGTLSGTWTASGRGPWFYKSVDGIVHIGGRATTGVLASQIFVLPPGFRPVEQMQFAINSNGAYGSLRIDPSGAVVPTAGSVTQVSLSGVQFPTF